MKETSPMARVRKQLAWLRKFRKASLNTLKNCDSCGHVEHRGKTCGFSHFTTGCDCGQTRNDLYE